MSLRTTSQNNPHYAESRVGLFGEEAEQFDTLWGQLASAHCRFLKPFMLMEVVQTVLEQVERVRSHTMENSESRTDTETRV